MIFILVQRWIYWRAEADTAPFPSLPFIAASHSELRSCSLSLQHLDLEKIHAHHHQQCVSSINALNLAFPNRKVEVFCWTCAALWPVASRHKLGWDFIAHWQCHGYLAGVFHFSFGSQHFHGHVHALASISLATCSSPQALWRSHPMFAPVEQLQLMGCEVGETPWNRRSSGDFHVCQSYENACKKKMDLY